MNSTLDSTEKIHGADATCAHLRFHKEHFHLDSVFGGDWFSLKAEAFARFFGTPFFWLLKR